MLLFKFPIKKKFLLYFFVQEEKLRTEVRVKNLEESVKQSLDKVKVTDDKLKRGEEQLATITEKLGSAEYEKNEALKDVREKIGKVLGCRNETYAVFSASFN